MKLLFVHQNLGEFGGAEANIRISATELRNRGHTVGLLYSEGTGRNEPAWREIFSQCFQLPVVGDSEFVKAILQQFDPDAIYLHNLSDLGVLESLVRSPVPVVRMVHDHALYCMRTYRYNYFTRRICTRPLSPYCLFPCLASVARNSKSGFPLKWVGYAAKKKEILLNQRCEQVVVYSDYVKQELVRNGFAAERINVCVPIRMWSDEARISSFSSRNLILFAGQLIRGKGADMLLHALAKVRTHFECDILGDGSHRRLCERLCARLGISDRVRFCGYVLPADLSKFYRDASVFVMGSLWPEPFGMAGPEAMRYGLPVVAFDAGGIREWLTDGDNGYLIPWKNVDLFAARLDQLLRNKELARSLGRRAFESVQRYDSCRQLDQLECLFEKVVRLTKDAPLNRTRSAKHLPAYE